MSDVKELWKKYDAMVTYNSNFKSNKDYYESIKVCNDLYNGDQWGGAVQERNLPQMTFNIIKRVVDFKIASLTTSDVSVNVEPLEYVPQKDENGQNVIDISDLINAEIKNLFEKWNMRARKKEALLDGAITGDMCMHFIFNPKKQPYRGSAPEVLGEIEMELIDATNVGFGNANIRDVEKQPYIVVVGRDTVKNLQKEIKGREKTDIKSDNDTLHQASDFADVEVEIEGDNEGKALYIYVYTKRDDKVYVSKCTKDAIIYDNIDTGLTRYPIAFSNWYKQKGTYHGRGEVEGIGPNQIGLNKMFSMVVYHQMLTSFPTAVYDKELLPNWSNKIGTAFGIEGLNGRGLKEVATYLNPANMSDYIIKVIDLAFQYTKECLGVSDASLGQIDPKNTSAIIAVQRSTAVPLENIKDNLYDLFEQTVLIIIDMMGVKYGNRPVVITGEDGTRTIQQFDFSQLAGVDLKTSVDVGETTYYSEIASIQTLDNLLQQQLIDFVDYLERMPSERIPQKAELMQKIKARQEQVEQQQADQQMKYEQMAQFLESLPPEQQKQILALPPEQQEQVVMQLMQQVR